MHGLSDEKMHVYNNNEMPHTWILNLRIFIIPIVLYLLYVLKEYRVSQTSVKLRTVNNRSADGLNWNSDGDGTTRKITGTETASITKERSSKETRDWSSTCFISM